MIEKLKNNLFGYSATVWVNEGKNDKYKYFYQLSFEWGGTNPDTVCFIYFTQEGIEIPPKIKIYRKGLFEIEENIVKIKFSHVLYNVWNTLDYPVIEEDLVIELDIKTDSENDNENYSDKIVVKQMFGENIFIDYGENEQLIFKASRMVEEI